MNLTSKRMLQFLAGCAGVFALSASATQYVADDFEAVVDGGTTNGAADMSIAVYKSQPYGTSNEFTNNVWYAESDDASKLVAGTPNYVGIRPMAGSDQNLVLNLETNGKTLVRTNDNNSAHNFMTTPVYVDTLIKFTPSEDNPSLDSMDASVKAAVFVNVSSNLVIYHKDGDLAKTMTDTGLFIDPAQWYRLTIMLSQDSGTPLFKVYLNGSAVTNGAPIADEWYVVASDEQTLSAVAFQGTGMVDELVVTDVEPDGIGQVTAIMLTLAFDPAQVLVTTGGVSVANGTEVPSPTDVSIYAKPWFQITSGGALLSNATSNLFSSAVTSIVGTVTSATEGQFNTVTSAAFDSTTGLPTGFGDADIAELSAWATANSVTPEAVTEAMLDDYLLNVAPGTDAGIEITSIVYDGSVATITIAADDPAVDFTDIYGILNVWTTDDLATPFAPIDGNTDFTVTGTTATEITVEVNVGAGQFIKARIAVNSEYVPE